MSALKRSGFRAEFSIFHLLILLAIVSLAASLAVPSWFARVDVTLDNAAKLLAEDLRDTQNRAALHHRPLQVVFFADGSGYEIQDMAGRALEAPAGHRAFRRCYDEDAVFSGVRCDQVSLGPDWAARYDSRGLALTNGEIVLRFGDETRTVRIVGLVGRLEIEGMRKPWTDGDF